MRMLRGDPLSLLRVMLLTITTTHQPATDLGYLLHKHPQRVQEFGFAFGSIRVFYPEATEARCTAAMLLDIDPIELARGGGRRPRGPRLLRHYVNDRPYAASSMLSVALGKVYRTALNGRCDARPELARMALPLQAQIAALPCRGGPGLLRRLFEPLGYSVQAEEQPLDARFPEWGSSPYLTVTLAGSRPLSELLAHLYVLIPVLDDQKHYWVGEEEVAKLVRRGSDWLGAHPERDLIAHRYLRRKRWLAREALARLAEEEDSPETEEVAAEPKEPQVERPLRLHDQRLEAVTALIGELGARSVLDLGCGEGRLLRRLLHVRRIERLTGLDVSHRSLQRAQERLGLERLPKTLSDRITLLHGALTYRDQRLDGYDVAAIVEVIEHLDPARLGAFERVVFECARPGTVIVTTPNIEYNVRFQGLRAGRLRHGDHRFEWTREEFRTWGDSVAARFGYAARYQGIGPTDAEVGAPSQMAVFTRSSPPESNA